ncbi:MAG: IS630 family transposase [Pseudomonadota bacterium]
MSKPIFSCARSWPSLPQEGVRTGEDAVSRLLKRHGLTRKKKALVAKERDRADVRQARTDGRGGIGALVPEQLVIIDESGFDTKMTRRSGRPPRGTPCFGKVPHGHWHNNTFVAGLRSDRIDAPMLFNRAMNGPTFAAWIEDALVPTLRPGDIVICDNLSIHKNAEAREVIAAGATLRFLPPYSPDLNPIEMLFAKLKGIVKSAAPRTYNDLCDALARALYAVPSKGCAKYLSHSGYGSS